MIDFPPAKINIGLRILRKREDGYHDIESVFYPVPWCDVLEIHPSVKFRFESFGLNIPGDIDSNLCIKAWEIMHREYQIPPVHIQLLKQIPMGAGLGGGSADGAFTLRMLNELFELSLSSAKLESLALELGSDCPFFIKCTPALISGRGEVMESFDLDLKGYSILLVNPGVHISTAEAYASISPFYPADRLGSILGQAPGTWQGKVHNDFQSPLEQNHPELRSLWDLLQRFNFDYVSMTGSGSTYFAIFKEQTLHKDLYIQLEANAYQFRFISLK